MGVWKGREVREGERGWGCMGEVRVCERVLDIYTQSPTPPFLKVPPPLSPHPPQLVGRRELTAQSNRVCWLFSPWPWGRPVTASVQIRKLPESGYLSRTNLYVSLLLGNLGWHPLQCSSLTCKIQRLVPVLIVVWFGTGSCWGGHGNEVATLRPVDMITYFLLLLLLI